MKFCFVLMHKKHVHMYISGNKGSKKRMIVAKGLGIQCHLKHGVALTWMVDLVNERTSFLCVDTVV